MQLSSEIDRFNGKVPYLESAGGIVGMSPEHWRKINGFGNNYFGWGGEDDELFHRLRINSLLRGDCYPFCTAGDKRQGKPGYSIKRPSKGHGVFSGKYMHSANHTKRITDSKAYERNLKQLEEIRRDHPRWRADGLQDLAFRILSTSVDTTDSATHASPTTTSRPAAAAPPSTCEASSSRCQPTSAHRGAAARGSSRRLGDATPWDVASLRQRAAQPARLWDCPGAAGASFLLLDRRRGLAKVLADASPRLLVVFFRSLVDPAADGLIIADPRPVGDLLRAFEEAAALFRPAVAYSFCTARVKTGGLKYGVYQSAACGGDGWDSVDRASWLAFATPRPGLIPVTWCVNEKCPEDSGIEVPGFARLLAPARAPVGLPRPPETPGGGTGPSTSCRPSDALRGGRTWTGSTGAPSGPAQASGSAWACARQSRSSRSRSWALPAAAPAAAASATPSASTGCARRHRWCRSACASAAAPRIEAGCR
ncbi:unnamed protein product [Prorocentrum cordatum]|uniref:Galactosyltransferase C-terminal domain-containing protein n=1 Tax=Prorocentrum cordatum TaxID=2364126 RepID=A0ABN9S5A0_9DINO|nr:unnamed protein product [Polarella glacialis]